MPIVFVVQHVHTFKNKEEDVKFIGVFSSNENAKRAVARLKKLPGFSRSPKGFYIDRYELDKVHWEEGFISS
jgi:hypothetical protein